MIIWVFLSFAVISVLSYDDADHQMMAVIRKNWEISKK